jgi:hypothetical protein
MRQRSSYLNIFFSLGRAVVAAHVGQWQAWSQADNTLSSMLRVSEPPDFGVEDYKEKTSLANLTVARYKVATLA